MTSLPYDTAYERIGHLAETMAEARDRNEATTRLQLIDILVFDCLGWSRDEAVLEDHTDGTYADYVLADGGRYLVLEAKREGEWFNLPEGLGRVTRLPALYGLGGAVASALEQAERCAQRRGTKYAAVCNGHQLVAFVASRDDGVAPRDGQALTFTSPDELQSDFALLWETLTPHGCRTRRLSQRLIRTSPTPPPKLAERIANYPGVVKADQRQLMLSTLQALFMPNYLRGDAQEIEFLTRCYCPPGAYPQLSALNRGLLRARYSNALGRELKVGLEEARSKEGLSPELVEEVAATSADRQPIVLLGHVGVGKTMFLRRLLLVDAQDLAADGILLYVDLGRGAVLEDLRVHVAHSLRTQLLESYGVDIDQDEFLRGTYHAEVRQFAKGVDSQLADIDPPEFKRREIDRLRELAKLPEEHLGRSLEHLVKLRGKQVVIVLDNIDQRSPDEQEQTFVMAEAMASKWPCTVFITLRPETFNASRIRGTLSAYQTRAFTIQPPRVERMVLERLRFGKDHYEQHGRLPAWIGYTAESEDLRRYLDIMIKSFTRSTRLQEMLIDLSGGNARKALELVSQFVTSPHAEADATLSRTGDYVIPRHLFLRATLLGDRLHYEPSASRIPNLFDISTADTREHFLLPCLLGVLRRATDNRDTEGYVDASEIFSACQDLGFVVDQVDFALGRAKAGDLADFLPPDSDPRAWRLTSVGAHAHGSLTAEFTYFDVIVVDTPIADPAVRGQVNVVHSIRHRLERCRIFLAYLDQAWEQSGLDSAGVFDWVRCSSAVAHEMNQIEDRL